MSIDHIFEREKSGIAMKFFMKFPLLLAISVALVSARVANTDGDGAVDAVNGTEGNLLGNGIVTLPPNLIPPFDMNSTIGTTTNVGNLSKIALSNTSNSENAQAQTGALTNIDGNSTIGIGNSTSGIGNSTSGIGNSTEHLIGDPMDGDDSETSADFSDDGDYEDYDDSEGNSKSTSADSSDYADSSSGADDSESHSVSDADDGEYDEESYSDSDDDSDEYEPNGELSNTQQPEDKAGLDFFRKLIQAGLNISSGPLQEFLSTIQRNISTGASSIGKGGSTGIGFPSFGNFGAGGSGLPRVPSITFG